MIPIRFVWRFGIWDLLVREQILCVMEQVLVLCVQRLLVGSTLQYFLDTQRSSFPGSEFFVFNRFDSRDLLHHCDSRKWQYWILLLYSYRTTGDGSFNHSISSGWLRTNRRIHFNSFRWYSELYSFNWTLSYFGVYLSCQSSWYFRFKFSSGSYDFILTDADGCVKHLLLLCRTHHWLSIVRVRMLPVMADWTGQPV